MSHFFSDLFNMPGLDEADEHYDENGRIKCRRCKHEDLEWDKHHHDATGSWRLWEGHWPEGRVHLCRTPNRVQAALDFNSTEES